MYFIKIYNNTKTEQIARIDNFIDLSISLKLNEKSIASFTVADKTNYVNKIVLQKKNHIEVLRKGAILFTGVINDIRISGEKLTVQCEDYFNILDARYTSKGYSGWNLGNLANDLINEANLVANTYITNIVYSSSNSATFDFDDSTVFTALKKVRDSGGEFKLEGNLLTFADLIGNDMTSSPFKFIETRMNETNIKDYSLTEEGKEIYNSIVGIDKNGVTVTKEDPVSIAKYGKFIKKVKFNDTDDLTTLNNLTQSYLDNHSEETLILDFKPLKKNLDDFQNFGLGDTVRLIIEKGYVNVDNILRIVGIGYSIKNKTDMEEGYVFELSKTNIPSKNFFQIVGDIEKRVQILELQ